jgi:hypothetical protein
MKRPIAPTKSADLTPGMPSTGHFEFVPPGELRPLIVRRIGPRLAIALLFQPLHWMVGVEICGGAASVAMGPLILGIGFVRPVSPGSAR